MTTVRKAKKILSVLGLKMMVQASEKKTTNKETQKHRAFEGNSFLEVTTSNFSTYLFEAFSFFVIFWLNVCKVSHTLKLNCKYCTKILWTRSLDKYWNFTWPLSKWIKSNFKMLCRKIRKYCVFAQCVTNIGCCGKPALQINILMQQKKHLMMPGIRVYSFECKIRFTLKISTLRKLHKTNHPCKELCLCLLLKRVSGTIISEVGPSQKLKYMGC